MYNNKNIHAHNGRIPDTPILHSNDEFSGCHLINSGNAPTSVKPAPPKQSTTSVLRQWRRPDTVDSGPKHAPSKYAKLPADNPGYPATLDNPAEYSMYNQQQHSTAVPSPQRPYLSHVQYGDSTGYNRASPVQPPKQDARVPDAVVKYSSTGPYYAQDSTGEVHYRGGNYPGHSTPPLAHSANAKVTPNYSEGHNYGPGNQKLSPNYHYPMVYHQKIQQHETKSTSQGISDEQNSYCLKSGTYPVQNRVPQHGLAPSGHPNVPYSLQNQLDRRQSPQESSQPYYVNKSACLSQELRHGRQSYAVDKPGGYAQVYAQTYLAQKPGPQEQKSRDYRQLVQSPTKKSPPFPILEQRLSAESSFYPEYSPGAYAHHKYGPVMLPGSAQKNYLNTSGPKFPPEDIIPSTYAKYYSQSKVAYEPNHYLLQMNQMQTRLNPNLFSRSTELPRDVAYMDQTPRGLQKSRVQYNAVEASQYGAKSSNVGTQKPAKIVAYSTVQDQRLTEHPPGEYFRNYPKPQSVIQSSKMVIDAYNMPGRTEAAHEPQSYAYSPPLIHQSNRPALAQYPTNYRPSTKSNEVSSGNISPRRTFQENMPVVVIPPQCIGLPKASPPQYSVPGQDYPQMYPNYLPKDTYYPGSNIKPGNVQYRSDQLVKQPLPVSRNIQVQSSRVLPAYPGPQYQQSSPDGPPEKIYYPPRSIYNQQVVQAANPSYSAAYGGPDYRGYEAASVVRSAYAKKEVDIGKSLKEYLESWEDDEDIVTNLPDVVLCNNIPAEKQKHVSFVEPITEAKSMPAAEKPPEDETTSQPLYILDSTNISSEALSQYLHIQQIDHLPANIKGYYKLPGVAGPLELPADSLEKSSRPAADQKSQNSKQQQLKAAETKADLHTRNSQGPGRVAEKAESPVGKPERQIVTAELAKMNPKSICAQNYSKTRELNILEVTELRIPEISTELAENAAENASPQDYSVNKRGAAEILLSADAKMTEHCEESRFQNCVPQDFSITRKSDAGTTFQAAEKISDAAEVTVEPVPQDYSINKQSNPDRLVPVEAGHLSASENTTEASVIHPNTPEDYSESLQEDVALNLSTNRSKFEDNSEDGHLLQETLREADSSIIEESTKTSSATKLQGAVLQGSNEERAELHDEDKVSSSNTRNLHPEPYANKFSSKLNEDSPDEASSVEETVVMEEYMEIQHETLQKCDSKLEIAKPAAIIQMHTASVIVQNTFFDDKASSKTLLEPLTQPFVPSSTPQIVQNFHQELVNDRSSSEAGSPGLQAGKPAMNLRPDSQTQLTNRFSINKDCHNDENVAQIRSENIISVAEDESSSYSSLEPSETSPPSSDTPRSVPTATLQDNSQSFDSFSAGKSSYESSEPSDLEKEVKQCRKKSLLDDYKQKMDENRSEQSSSECSEDEEDYTKQRTENEEICKKRKHDMCSGIETSDSEDQELFTSDNSDGEFDKERAEDSSTEEANTSKYRKIMSSADEETTAKELDQSTQEEQTIQDESRQGTADDQSTVKPDETSRQSTTTEEDTDDPAQSTAEVKSTIGQDETSQSPAEEECNLEESSTITEKDCQESKKEQSTIRNEELGDNIRESTVKLDELSESTTGDEGTILGDECQGTTDEESTIIYDEEAKKIGTTEPVLHQSTDEVVQDKESASTIDNQAIPEDAMVENTAENYQDQENMHNNSASHQETVEEIASKNTDIDEDCKDLARGNNSPNTVQEPSQQCNNCSNNSSESVQELTVCQCKKVATCNDAHASVQEYSAASRQCNKIAPSNNAQETLQENICKYVVLDQECKTNEIIELNNDNQVIISVDNQVDSREATSGSQPCTEHEAQSEDSACECEDIKDCNDLEQSENTELHRDSCFLGNSTDKSEDRNIQTNTEEHKDTAWQSQDTKLIIDKEEIKNSTLQYKDTDREYEAKDICMGTGEDSGTTLQFEDTDLQFEDTNSVLLSEDEDTLRSLEELRDVSLQSEDAMFQSEETALLSEDSALESEDTVLKTCTTEAEIALEDLTEEASKIVEENVPELKKHMILIDGEDNSCEANKSALGDGSVVSTKSEDFLIEKLISIDEDNSNSEQLQETIPTDSFEREMENIFKNIPKDPIVPGNQVPEINHSEIACLATSTIKNRKQSETIAPSIDNLKQPEVKLQTLDEPGLQLESDNSGRTKRGANIPETSRKPSTSFEEHSSVQETCETLALTQDDLSSRDFVEDLSSADDEMPEDLVEVSIGAVPGVASPGNILAADECLVIYSSADDFVILEEPETVFAETIVEEDDRIGNDAELICEQLGTRQEAIDEQMLQADVMIEQIVGESEEDVQELEDNLMPATEGEVDISEKLVTEQEINIIRAEPDDKQLNPGTVDDESQELSENEVEIPVNDSVKSEDLLKAELQQTYHELQMTADDVKSEQADVELELVSEIEVTEHTIKHEIKEEQDLKMEDVGTLEEFELDVKEEIVHLEICAEDVQVEDAEIEDNVDLKEAVLDCKKNVEDRPVRKEDDVGAAVKDEKPEELVKEKLLPTEATSDEKMEVELKVEDNTSQKIDKEGRFREELEEGELSDQSEPEEAQDMKTDVIVIDDWDEPEELVASNQLQVPISQEKKLLFARRKKNLEKLKAKFLLAKKTQLDSKASAPSRIHTSAVKITEVIQPSTVQSKPSKTTIQVVSSSEVYSPEIPKPGSNKKKESCRRDSPGAMSVSLKYTGSRSSINSAPSISDVYEDSSTNRSINPTRLLPRKISANFSFDSDEELFQRPTTCTNTQGCSKPSTTEDRSSVHISLSCSSSLLSKSSSSKAIRPSTDLPLCASAETFSKSAIVESTPEDIFQPPQVLKPFRASVEDKELFINPENPRYQPRYLDSRKRSLSSTDYSSLKIEFTAPKRRYSAMEAARPVRKPIINLDEISQNISQVLERLDSTEKQRYDEKGTYNQRKGSLESMERARNDAKVVTESECKEKLMNQEWNEQAKQSHFAHSDIFYIPKPSHRNKLPNDNLEQKQGTRKLDHFKVFEKMAQRKSLKVLPVNLYDDEECILNAISGRKELDSKSIREEPTASSALGVLENPEELDQSMANDQRLSTDTFPAPSLLEDHKITSTGPKHTETSSVRVSKTQEQVDSAHHMPKAQHSNTLTAVKPSTQEITSAHQFVNMEADPVESPEGIASSHHLDDSGRCDPLADVPSTLVDPILVLPKVSYNPRTKKMCGVKNGQQKLCKSTNQSEKCTERRPGNAASKEISPEKLIDGQMKIEENKEGKNNLSHTKEDNEIVKNQIGITASLEEGQPKMLGNKEESKLKHKGRNEDSQAKIKGYEGRQKVKTSNRDNQKLEPNKADSQKPRVTDEDCLTNFKGRKEDETKIEGTKEHGQMEIQRSEEEIQKSGSAQMKIKDNQLTIKTSEDKSMICETEEYIQTEKNASSICEGVSLISQCHFKKNSDIVRSGDNMVRGNVVKVATIVPEVFNVDTSTAKSSTALDKRLPSILDTSPHKQVDSTDLLAGSSSNEALLSSVQSTSSNTKEVSTNGPITIKSSSANIKVALEKPQTTSSNAKRGRPESQRTSVNVKSSMVNMKSGKLNAIIAKLGSANLQAVNTVALKAQSLHSSNVNASESLASAADRSSKSTQGTEDDLISTVNQQSSSVDSPAGSKAATVGQLVTPEGHASTGGQLTTAAGKIVSTVGRRASAVDQLASPADQVSIDRHSDQLILPGYHRATAKGKNISLADQHPNSVILGCSANVILTPKITNSSSSAPSQCSSSAKGYSRPIVSSSFRNIASKIPSTGSSIHRDSSNVQAVSGSLHNAPPASVASNTTSFSVIVEPTGPKRKVSDPRNDSLAPNATEVKRPEHIENKLSNTFRLTEYTKSYIKLKMSQEMGSNIANGLKQSGPRLGHKPIRNCSQQLKRKLPNSDKDTAVTAGLDKRVKINLQDYRNRKQHATGPGESKIAVDHQKNSGEDSFDDCLGEVVNGIDDFMTVIETNEVTSEKYSIGNSSSESVCLDLTRRSSNLGIEMTDLEIYMDDSMELIPGNEEIVHTSKEEDLLSECRDNSGTEDPDTSNESNSSQDRLKPTPTNHPAASARKMRIRMICKPDSAIDQARFEDVSFPGPSKVVQTGNKEDDDRVHDSSSQNRNEKIPLPKTAMVKRTKETIPTNTNHPEPNVTNTPARRRMKSKGEMKMYRPKRRKKRFRNLYTTDDDEESEVPTAVARNGPEMLPNGLRTVQLKTASVRATSEAIQDSSLASCASPEDYSHLVSIEPAAYKYRAKKHLLRLEECQETNSSSSSGDLPQLPRRQGYQHKRSKSRDDDDSLGSLPSCSDSSEAVSRKLEYKCHINLNALGNKCNMLASDPVQPSTSKMGLKLTLKSVRKDKPAVFSEVLECLDTSPTGNVARRSKHGKRKVPRKEHSAYSVSTSAASRGWTVNDKVPKVIIKRNGSGYCAVSRDVSTNPIWQPVIRVRRHRYIESLVLQGKGDGAP